MVAVPDPGATVTTRLNRNAAPVPTATATRIPYAIDDVMIAGSPAAPITATVTADPPVVLLDPGANAELVLRVETPAGDPLPDDVVVTVAPGSGTATIGQQIETFGGTFTFAAGSDSGSTQAIPVRALPDSDPNGAGSTYLTAQVTTTGTARPMHPEIEGTLLRTAQEALANVAKHAAASRVGLTLSYMEDQVTLDVRDDGKGFDPAAVPEPAGGHGFGLTGMRQRLDRVAGRLEIESEPASGTAVSASVPAVPAGGLA